MSGTEEVHASVRIARKETSQESKGSDQQAVIAWKQREKMRIDIVIEENAGSTGSQNSMEERFKSVMGQEDNSKGQLPQAKWPRIHKVPRLLRGTENFKKHFEPRVVSVGPYHHHKPELKPAERMKRQLTKKFVEESGQGVEVLYKKIESEISELRNCYKKKWTRKYNDAELAWMLLVDGCSLIQYMLIVTQPKLEDFHIMYQNAAFVQQDLFLLENQLPFRVLELLLESRFKQNERMQMIEQFIAWTIHIEPPCGTQNQTEEKPSHLLDLLRKRILGQPSRKGAAGGNSWNTYRNVKELKAAGIRFKSNKTGFWKDISFRSFIFLGRLELPPITVDDSTRSRFLNLIAYEMCPEVNNNSEVTSFLCFLDSLIDHPDDVKELRNQGVLLNLLGSDDEVAKLFNEITTDLVPNSDAYAGVKEKIQKHFENPVSTWVTQGLHSHFSSPWTILAFLGAILALFFTAAQTYYTVFPASN